VAGGGAGTGAAGEHTHASIGNNISDASYAPKRSCLCFAAAAVVVAVRYNIVHFHFFL
jgi:hypothetical protein